MDKWLESKYCPLCGSWIEIKDGKLSCIKEGCGLHLDEEFDEEHSLENSEALLSSSAFKKVAEKVERSDMIESSPNACITALKLLRDDMEKTRRDEIEVITDNDEVLQYYRDGWNACLKRLHKIVDEMIGEE